MGVNDEYGYGQQQELDMRFVVARHLTQDTGMVQEEHFEERQGEKLNEPVLQQAPVHEAMENIDIQSPAPTAPTAPDADAETRGQDAVNRKAFLEKQTGVFIHFGSDFGKKPVLLDPCPRCNRKTETRVEMLQCTAPNICCAPCTLGLIFLPCFMNCASDLRHSCPKCNYTISLQQYDSCI